MSKVGKEPIQIKDGINVTVNGQDVVVTGPKGNASYQVSQGITVKVEDSKVIVDAIQKQDKKIRALFGLTRAILANIIKGVDTGFEKKLELKGVGYKAQMQGVDLVLSLGFAHPVKFTPKPGVVVAVQDNVITVSGQDKSLVGDLADKIRAVKPPEPYKGKGIRYQGEYIRRKAGKAVKAGA